MTKLVVKEKLPREQVPVENDNEYTEIGMLLTGRDQVRS